MVVLIVNLLSTAFIAAVCTRIVADSYTDTATPRGEAVRVAGRRIFAIIGVSLLVAICEAIGVFFCFIGILVPMTFFAVAIPALILETTNISGAVGRSVTLVKNHFFRVLGVVIAAQVLNLVVSLGLSTAIGLLVRTGDNTTAAILGQGVASAVAATLTTPYVAAVVVVLYFDLRIRGEAYDVQLLMQRNDTRYAA